MYLDRKNPPPTLGEVIREIELETKKQIALELLKDGMNQESVARYVKLSLEEVKKLREQ